MKDSSDRQRVHLGQRQPRKAQQSAPVSEDDDHNPFLTDISGNLTKLRLHDLEVAFAKHLDEEASKPETQEEKCTRKEEVKTYNDRMERNMKLALQKYNNEEKLDEDMHFVFEEARQENFIVEGEYDNEWYFHLNFTAAQAGSMTCLFFAEVMKTDEDIDIICCKLLNDDDTGHCFGCKDIMELKHPARSDLFVGGHEDRRFPFLVGTNSEDESD